MSPEERAAADLARRHYRRELARAERADADAAERGAGPAGNTLAAALAGAFLAAGDWTPAHLAAAFREVIASPAVRWTAISDTTETSLDWAAEVAADIVSAYPRPPADRPREVAHTIARLRSFREHIRRAPGALPDARPAPRVGRRPVTATRTVRKPFHTTPIDHATALADLLKITIEDLLWYADPRAMNARAADRRLHHYRHLWLNGRLIEAPKPRLKAIQQRLLTEAIGPIPTHPAAHGFVPGKSPHTFAAPHAHRPMVVRLDVTSFFAAVTAPRVYGLFRAAGYPEPVAHLLTGLCTTTTPAPVRKTAAPDIPDRDYRLRLLGSPHLPQGAPTSPALANRCGFRLDRRLTGLADRFGAAYTRYADDLAFSGDLTRAGATELTRRVTAIAADEGFRINAVKTRVRSAADRQKLAGLVVNDGPRVPRDEYDALRALLHNAARDGLDAQNRDGLADFRAHVEGRVAWVGHRHPGRAAKLAAMLARVA